MLPCRTSIWTRLFNLVCGKVCLEEVTIMRKLIFIGIVAVGALVGLPFMKPQEAEPDKHMFDPDKLG